MIEQMLHNIDMFSSLDENEIKYLSDIITLKKYNENNIIFYEGEESNYFYILLRGEVKIYKTGINAKEIVLHYFSKPTLLAEMATLENIDFPATCMCRIDGTLIGKIKKEEFLVLLEKSSNLAFDIIKSLTKKIKNLEVSINRNLIFDATTKVCSLLIEDPNIFKNNKNIHIANLLNMTPETLSRTMTKLKKLEIISNENEIIDQQKLTMFLEF